MKIIEITPKSSYTCQVCHKTFETEVGYVIEIGLWPICLTYKCKFNLIYKTLQNYSKEQICDLCNVLNIEIPERRSSACFQITKKILPKIFSSLSSQRSMNIHELSGYK